MIKLGSVKVSFTHVDNKLTICTVSDRRYQATGNAKKSSVDHFEKDKGRKIALSKALKGMSHLSKKQRTNIWNDYRKMTKEPRW